MTVLPRAALVSAALLLSSGCLIQKPLYDAALDAVRVMRVAREAAEAELLVTGQTVQELQALVATREDELETERAALSERSAEVEACNRSLQGTRGALDETRTGLEDTRGELRDEQTRRARLSAEESTLRDQKAAIELERASLAGEVAVLHDRTAALGSDLRTVTGDKEAVAARLAEAEVALAESRQRAEEAEARAAIFEDLKRRLAAMIDAGTLSVRLDRGRMVVDIRQDVLFGSGSADLSAAGHSAASEVGAALAAIPARTFQVEGHTDNVPIHTRRFPSNWELSTARAVSVVKVLADAGVPRANVSAAGFADGHPTQSNDDAAGRAANRRIEIVMQPDARLLPGLVGRGE